MQVTLLHHSPLSVAVHAARTCHQSFDKSDGAEKDMELLLRVGNQLKHKSVLEHLVYTFYIQGISRACLQELARHRMASLSVKSTRYTLKELKDSPEFIDEDMHPLENAYELAEKYLVFTGNKLVDIGSIIMLDILRDMVVSGVSNDIAKYNLPESYKTELTWTINARSLQNFLELRTSKSALKEIGDLAYEIFEHIPADHHDLFVESVQTVRAFHGQS